jgi:hypothetical protein
MQVAEVDPFSIRLDKCSSRCLYRRGSSAAYDSVLYGRVIRRDSKGD